jgi:hypothetical protein
MVNLYSKLLSCLNFVTRRDYGYERMEFITVMWLIEVPMYPLYGTATEIPSYKTINAKFTFVLFEVCKGSSRMSS